MMPDLARWPSRAALRWITAAAFAATLGLALTMARHDLGLSPYTIVSLSPACCILSSRLPSASPPGLFPGARRRELHR